MIAEEHAEYVGLQCARVVESLRRVRDAYREFLEEKGCEPTAEMYWVVARFAVKDWAVMSLRGAAFDYISACDLTACEWRELFGSGGAYRLGRVDVSISLPGSPLTSLELVRNLRGLLHADVLDLISTGGPFGREQQHLRARSSPRLGRIQREETFLEGLKRRLKLWDTQVWAEGLSRLFDATQEEIFHQFQLLQTDGRQAQRALGELPKLNRVAYQHLRSVTAAKIPRVPGEDVWKPLLRELDQHGLPLEEALRGMGRKTLERVRKKGVFVSTFCECYDCTTVVILDDGNRRTLRRELTRSLHNAADKAARQLERIWAPVSRASTPRRKTE